MLVPSLISILLITLFVVFVKYGKKYHYSDQTSWNIVGDYSEEWPRRPKELTIEKNRQGVYLDRVAIVEDTTLVTQDEIQKFARIAGENISSLPLYTTDHSDQEHFLTTIHIAFHKENDDIFMDILSLDKDFPLRDHNRFSLLFTNGVQWDFSFTGRQTDEFASSIPLTKEQLLYFSQNSLNKWRLKRDKDDYFTVGNLGFDIRKYVYKPEIQATIQMMATILYDSL